MPGQECLLVKTASEIALKSNFVRRFFTKKLTQSIRFALKRNSIKCDAIARGGGRLYVFCSNPKKAQKILSTVEGIHATAIALHHKPASYPELEKQALSLAKKFLRKGNSFALDVSASANKEFSSKDLENRLGAAIQKAIPGLEVRLKNPEKKIFIELREKEFFLYTGELPGMRGLPLGVEGSVALMLSGKRDDLLAALLLMRRGCNVFPVAKKKSSALEKKLHLIEPFSDYRKFILTEESQLPGLIEERKIQAIATADSKADSKSLAQYRRFDKAQELVVLRPLLLYPKEKRKELEKLLFVKKL